MSDDLAALLTDCAAAAGDLDTLAADIAAAIASDLTAMLGLVPGLLATGEDQPQ